MKQKSINSDLKIYEPLEERINILSHFLGFLLSIAALIVMVYYAYIDGNVWHIVSFSVFGCSLIFLYAASTIYHNEKDPTKRKRLRIIDHAAIYVLIAGTYTPFALITLNGSIGWTIFALVWGFAAIGITLKLFFTGRFNILSTSMYIAMGWLIIFAIDPLLNSLDPKGVAWLIAGGMFYTIGAIIFSIKRLRFNHALFHLFVLLGSFCHFMAVFYYVLPS